MRLPFRRRSMLDFSFVERADWGWGAFLEDYALLIGLVLNLKPRSILEIGTHSGLGAVVLAYAGTRGWADFRLTTVDVDQSLGRSNLALVPSIEGHIEFIEGSSSDVLPELARRGRRFDLVFIDGAHDYAQALSDWENAQPLSSTWVLHDTTQFTGLQRLVQEIRETREYDVFQCMSAPGHRKHPTMGRERFITGLTFVQSLSNLDVLPQQAHMDDHGRLLPGHPEREVPGLVT